MAARQRRAWCPQRLRERRERQRLTLEQVAEELRRLACDQDGVEPGATAQTVWRHERGQYPGKLYRRRAELLSALATAVTRQGRLDEGCVLAQESLSLAIGAGSAVGVERVRRFRRELDRWHDAAPVVRLDENLAVA